MQKQNLTNCIFQQNTAAELCPLQIKLGWVKCKPNIYWDYNPIGRCPHQWSRGCALKTGRRKVPGSIPGRVCRPNRSEFSVVFAETLVNMGQDPLERPPPAEGIPPISPGPTCGQLALSLQHNTTQLGLLLQRNFLRISDKQHRDTHKNSNTLRFMNGIYC